MIATLVGNALRHTPETGKVDLTAEKEDELTRICHYQVATADSGHQALDLMSKCGEFDLVLSDWRMDEMNGLELLKNVKQKVPPTVVILMTAYGRRHPRHQHPDALAQAQALPHRVTSPARL